MLFAKTLVPITLAVVLGLTVGIVFGNFAPDALGIGGFTTALFRDGTLTLIAVLIDGILGVSVLALITIFGNSNGALWLAFAGQYGDERDRGAYVASAFDDGPFLALIFLGASGLGNIPIIAIVAAVVPFIIGLIIGAVDR